MEEFKVIWTKSAVTDLEDILEYIKLASINIAKKVFSEIKKECSTLNYFPKRKKIVYELQELGILKYRELIYKRYRIIFKIEGSKVYVLLVIDSSRNLEDILFQRLIKEK